MLIKNVKNIYSQITYVNIQGFLVGFFSEDGLVRLPLRHISPRGRFIIVLDLI